MNDGRDWAALAEAVEARRDKLGITQVEVQARGGPSSAMISKIERQALDDTPRRRTLRSLDRALGWVEGSSDAILAGGTPTLVHGEAAPVDDLDEIIDLIRQEAERVEADRDLPADIRQDLAESLRRSYLLYRRLKEAKDEREGNGQAGTQTA